MAFLAIVVNNFVNMINREGTYITSIEKGLQVVNATNDHDEEHGPDFHTMEDYNTMFFVVKNYTNAH